MAKVRYRAARAAKKQEGLKKMNRKRGAHQEEMEEGREGQQLLKEKKQS